MIFVIVGTHEQQFNRLVEYMDKWAEKHKEEVIIQTGFSIYEPKFAKWQKLFPYKEMDALVKKARIVITHGGPSSFIAPLKIGKIPIVVPRRKEFGEHVNDHQLIFCREVAERQKNIIEIEDVEYLGLVIRDYENIIKKCNNASKSNNDTFCQMFEEIVDSLFQENKL